MSFPLLLADPIQIQSSTYTILNHTETNMNNSVVLDYSIFNLNKNHKHLIVESYAFLTKTVHQNLPLSISLKYVIQKNNVVIDSEASKTEEIMFMFLNGVSHPFKLFEGVVDKFDYLDIQMIIKGNLNGIDHFTFNHSCSNSMIEYQFEVLTFFCSAFFIALFLLFSSSSLFQFTYKSDYLNLRVQMIVLNFLGISIGISKYFKNEGLFFVAFSAFSAVFKIFLFGQIYYISSRKSTFVVDIISLFIVVPIAFCENKSMKARHALSFLPFAKQMQVLPEEYISIIFHILFLIILTIYVVFALLGDRETVERRFAYVMTISIIIFISTIYTQIYSVYYMLHILACTSRTLNFFVNMMASATSIILFLPSSKFPEYMDVLDYNTDLDVDTVSE